jgi:hypothetical protein
MKLILFLMLLIASCGVKSPTSTEVQIDTVYIDTTPVQTYTNLTDTLYLVSRSSMTYIIYGATEDDSLYKEDVTSTEIEVEDSLYISAIFPIKDTMIIQARSYRTMSVTTDTFYNIQSKQAYCYVDDWRNTWEIDQMWKINKEKEELEDE